MAVCSGSELPSSENTREQIEEQKVDFAGLSGKDGGVQKQDTNQKAISLIREASAVGQQERA
jgi:hypothetical protein